MRIVFVPEEQGSVLPASEQQWPAPSDRLGLKTSLRKQMGRPASEKSRKRSPYITFCHAPAVRRQKNISFGDKIIAVNGALSRQEENQDCFVLKWTIFHTIIPSQRSIQLQGWFLSAPNNYITCHKTHILRFK